jgi:hypothetical protein
MAYIGKTPVLGNFVKLDAISVVDGQGVYIAEWNLDIAQPTDAQLASYETVANTAEANAQVDATRKSQYGSWGDQLDEMYHDIEAWKTRIQTIKDNNPKG